jgi:hypothetical protein
MKNVSLKQVTIEMMVENFQCPGCVSGVDTHCGAYKLEDTGAGKKCANHCAGTICYPAGKIALGLPKGFNKVGVLVDKVSNIRLHLDSSSFTPDNLNVAVWAMVVPYEGDNYLFVRTFCPRINYSYVDIILNASLSLVPNAINVKDID